MYLVVSSVFLQISWIRHTDSGLLAVNDFVYTTSHRIKVFHDNGSSEWRLSINPVELSDGGFYECQVSTTPHTSHFMAINVIGKLINYPLSNKIPFFCKKNPFLIFFEFYA